MLVFQIGFFSYQGNSYEITPLDDAARRKRDASSHRVEKRALPYGNFYGDELTPPPGRLLKERNRKKTIMP